MSYEVWVTRKGVRGGQPYAERRTLQVSWDVATGRLERCSDLVLRELCNDILAEQERRLEAAIKQQTGGYDPMASQILRPKEIS